MNINKRASLLLATRLPLVTSQAADISRCNVIWTSPSKDASGVMPIGSGGIFKTGRVRVSLNPNPFQAGKPPKTKPARTRVRASVAHASELNL